MDKDILKQILNTQKADLLRRSTRTYLKRELDLKHFADQEEITIITGVRRSGKSSLLEQYIKSLKNIDTCIYINFEDPQLLEFTAEDFSKAYDIWLETNIPISKGIAVFDEIQNVEGWERWMNFFSKQKGFKVFISGSNSNLLSTELGTHLTGRHRSVILFPLSLKEIIINHSTLKDISIPQITREDSIALELLSKNIIEIGGFPRVWITKDTAILAEYYNNILIRDIVKRKKIKNILSLEKLGLILMSNVGRKINKAKIAGTIGLQKGETVEKYIAYFEECFLGFQIKKYDPSARKQLRSQSKFYAIDPSLANRVGLPSDSKATYYLENLVLLELLRRGGKVYYWNSKDSEIDFFVETADRKRELIQVCWNIENPSTLAREMKGFESFASSMKGLKIDKKIVITLEGGKRSLGNEVDCKPFYEWATEV